MATIGELIINLKASTASFVTDLNRVKNLSFETSASIQRSFQVMGVAAAGMLGTFAVGMAVMIEKTTESAAHILHLAQSAGTTTEVMSGLGFAAKMVGQNVDEMALAMERFDKKLLAAQMGMKTNQGLFQAMGIDPAKIKQSDEALKIIADRFSQMADGAQKTGIAMQFFGKAGAAMIPVLNLGAKGIEDFIAQAKALGLIISTDTALAAEHFQQNIKLLEGALTGMQLTIMKEVLPNLNALTDALVKNAKDGAGSATAAGEAIVSMLKVMASAIVIGIAAWQTFGTAFRVGGAEVILLARAIGLSFEAMGMAMARHGQEASEAWKQSKEAFKAYAEAHRQGEQEIQKASQGTSDLLAAVWGKGTTAISKSKQALLDYTDALAKAGKDDALTKQIAATIKSLNLQMATFGLNARALQEYKYREDGVSESTIHLIDHLSNLTTVYGQIHASLEQHIKDVNDQNEATKLQVSYGKTHFEQMQAELEKEGLLTTATIGLGKAMEDTSTVWAQFGQVSTKPLLDATGDVNALTEALQHQINDWGKTADAITLEGLAAAGALPAQIAQVKALQDALEQMNKRAQQSAIIFYTLRSVTERAFTEMIFSGKKLSQVFGDILKQLGEMLLKIALFGTSGTGGLLGGLFEKFSKIFDTNKAAATAAPPIIALGTAATTAATAVTALDTAVLPTAPAFTTLNLSSGILDKMIQALSASAESAAMALKQLAASAGSGSGGGGGFLGALGGLFSLFGGGGGGGGGGLGDMIAGGFAEGGAVEAGVPIMVGEQGPEQFIPAVAGTIIPHGGGSGQQITIQYIIDARGADPTVDQRLRIMLQGVEDRAVQRAVRTQREMGLRTA